MKIFVTYISTVFLVLWVNVTCGQLVIGESSGITVTSGTSLYIGTDLYIKSDNSGTGHLADQNSSSDINITGSVTIERYLTQDGWHNISAPLDNLESDLITGTDLIFYYDETIIQNDWNFGWVMYDGPLDVMRGYDVFLPSTITANYFDNSSSHLNSGLYSIGVTKTDPANGEVESRKGWNLLGNPYVSPVDWLHPTAWDKSDINDAVYIWDPSNNNYTIFLGGSSPTGINGGTRYVPSSQGFWVQAIQDGTVSVSNPARVGKSNGTPGYYKGSNNEIRIIAKSNGYRDETLIRTIDGASEEFDFNLDASKLFTRHDSVPQVYSISNNNLLAVNTIAQISDSMIIDLSLSGNFSGMYQLEFNYDIDDVIFLYDKYEQEFYELHDGVLLHFEHHETILDNRFALYFNVDTKFMENVTSEPFRVAANGSVIKIMRNISDYQIGKIRKNVPNGKRELIFV